MPCAVPRCDPSGQLSLVQFPRSHFLYERWRSAIERGTGCALPSDHDPLKAEICQQHFEKQPGGATEYKEPVIFPNGKTGQTVLLSSCHLCLQFHPADRILPGATNFKLGNAVLADILKIGFGVQLTAPSDGGICEECLVRLDVYVATRKYFSMAAKSCKEMKLLVLGTERMQFRKIVKTGPEVVAIKWEIIREENSKSDSILKPLIETDASEIELPETGQSSLTSKDGELKKRKHKPKFKQPPKPAKDPTVRRPRTKAKKIDLKQLIDRKCYICAQMFDTREVLFAHMLEHVGCTLRCDICNESFLTITKYNRHLAMHDATERPKKCAFCELRFKTTPSLLRHEKRYHNAHQDLKIPKYNPTSRYACQHCGKLWVSKARLLEHEVIHSGMKRFQCKTCRKPFSNKANMERHLYIHTNEKPFKCETCGKGFRQSTLLKNHLRCHTGELPYECVTCEVSFRTTDKLRRHQISEHGLVRVPREKPTAATTVTTDGEI